MLRGVRRLLLLLVVGLVLAGCGGGPPADTTADTSDGDAAGASVSERAAGDGPSAAPSAPFGTVTLVDGERLDGARFAGDDLALWFWAPW